MYGQYSLYVLYWNTIEVTNENVMLHLLITLLNRLL